MRSEKGIKLLLDMNFRLLLFITLAVIGCKNPKTADLPAELPVDFQVFYELFHRDSAYQMEHITFPLAGLPDYAEPDQLGGTSYFWQVEDWTMHRPRQKEEEDFVRSVDLLSEGMVRERLIHKERLLMTERRFAKMGEEWYLIYYAGINTYTRQPAQ
jgi:hypothetical protein